MAETGSAAHSRPAPGRIRPLLRRALLLAGLCTGVTGGLLALSQAAQAEGPSTDGSSGLGHPVVLRTVVDAVHRAGAAEPVAALAPGLARSTSPERPASRRPASPPVRGIVSGPAARPVRAVLSAVRGLVPRPSTPDLRTAPPRVPPVRATPSPEPEPAMSLAGPAQPPDRLDLRARPGPAFGAAPPAAGAVAHAALVLDRVRRGVPTPSDVTPQPLKPTPLDPVPCPPRTTGSASATGTGHTDLADPPVTGPDPPVPTRTEPGRQAARLCGATILPDSRPG